VAAASFQSFPAMFMHRVQATPDSDAIYYPDANEDWKTLRWKDVGERVKLIACGLRAQGLEATGGTGARRNGPDDHEDAAEKGRG